MYQLMESIIHALILRPITLAFKKSGLVGRKRRTRRRGRKSIASKKRKLVAEGQQDSTANDTQAPAPNATTSAPSAEEGLNQDSVTAKPKAPSGSSRKRPKQNYRLLYKHKRTTSGGRSPKNDGEAPSESATLTDGASNQPEEQKAKAKGVTRRRTPGHQKQKVRNPQTTHSKSRKSSSGTKPQTPTETTEATEATEATEPAQPAETTEKSVKPKTTKKTKKVETEKRPQQGWKRKSASGRKVSSRPAKETVVTQPVETPA